MKTVETSYIFKTRRPIKGMEELEKYGEKVHVPAKYVLVRTGDEVHDCYIVKKGRVVACEYTKAGEKRIYHYCEENSLILEEYLLTGQSCPIEYMVEQPAELVRISREYLLKVISMDSNISGSIMEMMAEKILFSEERVRNENTYCATWKLCDLLIDFAGRYGTIIDGRVIIKEKISQQDMADFLGMNRITVVRELKNLREKHLIDKVGNYYCVTDLARLKQYQSQVA